MQHQCAETIWAVYVLKDPTIEDFEWQYFLFAFRHGLSVALLPPEDIETTRIALDAAVPDDDEVEDCQTNEKPVWQLRSFSSSVLSRFHAA